MDESSQLKTSIQPITLTKQMMVPQFVRFNSEDEYSFYFNDLAKVFERLLACYHVQTENHNHEARIIEEYLKRMLFTISALRMKHTYNPAHELKIDLTDSGFPDFLQISHIVADLLSRDERLPEFLDTQVLKQEVLDHMLKHQKDPEELLARLSERTYFEMLDGSKLFLPFVAGELELKAETKKGRSYLYSWGCFDSETNRPYIHLLAFDQDISKRPLHEEGANWFEFLEVIRREGSSLHPLGVMAVGIDQGMDEIHPKVLKRICLGPICFREYPTTPDDIHELLVRYGEENDFAILFEDEVVFSTEEKVSRTIFSFGHVREVFFIPETDLECYHRKISKVHKYMLLPHALMQNMGVKFPNYRDFTKITFDQKGVIYGV